MKILYLLTEPVSQFSINTIPSASKRHLLKNLDLQFPTFKLNPSNNKECIFSVSLKYGTFYALFEYTKTENLYKV